MKGSFDKLRTSSFGKAQNGQTLIEVLLALGTAVVVLSATVVAVLAALNNAQFSKNQNIATQYAQQGMEVMRNMRNSNWTLFSGYGGASGVTVSYCLDQNSTELSGRNRTIQGCAGGSSTNGQNVGIFARRVDIEKDSSLCGGSNQTKVTILVSWASNKCTDSSNLYCHSVKLVSCLGRP